ncbi:MAG: carbon-monoxide dehydrogenase small subunit [Candidatus Hydrogenedentota bacterium]
MPGDDSRKGTPDFSRRGFLKSMGVGAAATTLIEEMTSQVAVAEAGSGLAGPDAVPITLSINGSEHTVNVEPRVTLLDALRNHLDITGAKRVCDRGTCGACTVLLDDKPVYSCSMLAIEAQGHSITTVEGLGSPDNLHPIQKAFVEHDAQQCGFCTPGFVVACASLLKANANPSIEEIKAGLGGNLCRCGTYAGITAAVLDAAKGGAK